MENQKTALGLDGNVTALIGYLIPLVGLIEMFIEKENRFAKFHAAQSVFLALGFFVIYFVLTIFIVILSQISSVFGFLGFLMIPIWLIGIGLFIYCAVKGYKGEMFKLPVIGDIAEKMSNK